MSKQCGAGPAAVRAHEYGQQTQGPPGGMRGNRMYGVRPLKVSPSTSVSMPANQSCRGSISPHGTGLRTLRCCAGAGCSFSRCTVCKMVPLLIGRVLSPCRLQGAVTRMVPQDFPSQLLNRAGAATFQMICIGSWRGHKTVRLAVRWDDGSAYLYDFEDSSKTCTRLAPTVECFPIKLCLPKRCEKDLLQR